MCADSLGHGGDDLRGRQHAELGGVDPDVPGDRVELRADEVRRDQVDAVHTDGVLRGQRREHAHAEGVERGEGLEVGLDAGATAGVRARDREHPRGGRTGGDSVRSHAVLRPSVRSGRSRGR